MTSHYDKYLTFKYPVSRGQEKFRELILYIAAKCQSSEYFGAIKLNKILYRSDFRAYLRLGQPITGAEYFRLPRGPAPRLLVPMRRNMLDENLIEIEPRQMGNVTQERVVAKREADLSLFTLGEKAIVDEVIEELWDQTAADVSDASHDIMWTTRQDRESIPYEAVYLDGSDFTENEISRTHELAAQHGW